MNLTETMSKVKQNLKTLRTKNGYTQRGMAEKLEVHYTTYNKIELGENTLTLKNAQKLAAIYAVSLDAIISDVDLESTKEVKEPIEPYTAQAPIRIYIEIDGQKIEPERLPSLIHKLEALIAEENAEIKKNKS